VDFRADLGFDAEFLREFAVKRGLQFLARIDFAAGKFPVAAQRVVGQPLRDEEPSVVAADDPGHDIDGRMGHDAFLRGTR
jgi:hypothetical protein